MDPREAARESVSGNSFGIANLVKDPLAYLEPLENEKIHPSDIRGRKEPAARAGLKALEEAGVVERNGRGYEVKVDWSREDYEEFIDELEFQKDYVL
ncbi:MAG: hypothetical protein ABEJ69_01695 [Candidatus Nanohaloarchaea archaeon]